MWQFCVILFIVILLVTLTLLWGAITITKIYDYWKNRDYEPPEVEIWIEETENLNKK